MTATGHAILGAAIASRIPDFRLALPLALVSHFIGDLPDHWDAGNGWEKRGMRTVALLAAADVLLGYTVIFAVFILWLNQNPVQIYAGVLMAQLPDYLEIPYFFLKWHSRPWKWVNDIQMLFHKKLPQINLTPAAQIAISLGAIAVAAWR